MDSIFSELRRFFVGILMLLLTGWAIASSVLQQQFVERGFFLAPMVEWYYPVYIPRIFGLMFFLVLAGVILWSERKSKSGGDASSLGIAMFAYCLMALIGGVLSGISFWIGAWLTLCYAGLISWSISKFMSDIPVWVNLVAVFLALSCAIGVWTGLMNGLFHGLFGTLVYLAADPRPIRRLDLIGLSR